MTVDVLFIHPNFPGQFQRLAERLLRQPGFRLTGLGDSTWTVPGSVPTGLNFIAYDTPDKGNRNDIHPYLRTMDDAVRRGLQAANKLVQLKLEGYEPDVIYLHPGWGDGLYVKEVFPSARLIGLFEYYYSARGADLGFDPQYPTRMEDLFRVPLLNAVPLLALESCDVHLSPTQWQRSRFPEAYQQRIRSLHEGVETDKVSPCAEASVTLPDGKVLRAGDEVLTYVARGFEPYRGFHIFMQALPRILEQRPHCQVLIVGGDRHHYGPGPKEHASWREQVLADLPAPLDPERVHFTGPLTFEGYLKVLQVSRAHVYLTYPFVLSWSMLEAMAAGCLVVASATPPVEEVIEHGVNGLLFPFFDVDRQVECVVEALSHPQAQLPLRQAAVNTIRTRYDFDRIVYPQHLELLKNLLPEKDDT